MWRIRFSLNLIKRGEVSLFLKMSWHFVKKRLRLLSFVFRKLSQYNTKVIEFDQWHEPPRNGEELLTIIIPHVNYGRFLNRCIESIKKSSLSNFNVIIIESGSDEENLAIVKRIESENSDERFKFDYGPLRKLGSNRNYGIQKANSIFVCSFDPDDEMDYRYLEMTLFNAVYNCLDVSGSSMLAKGQENGIWQVRREVSYRDLIDRNALASNAIFTKKLWSKVGGFADSEVGEPHIHEDWRFWQRASLFGARIGNITFPLVTIHLHGQNMSRQSDVLPEYDQAKIIRKKNSDIVVSKKTSLYESKYKKGKPVSSRESFLRFSKIIKRDFEKTTPHFLFFLPWLDQSGSTKVMTRIAENLKEKRCRITFISTEKIPSHASELEIEFEHFPLVELLDQEEWLAFVLHIIASRNTTHIWQSGSSWFYENIKEIYSEDIDLIDSLYIPDSNHLKNSARLSKYFSRVYFETRNVQDSYRRNGGTASSFVIPNGIDIKERQELTDFSRRKYITFLGRLAPEKDPLSFLRVASIIMKENRDLDCSFVVAGDGPLKEIVLQEIHRLKLPVLMLGHVSDPSSLLDSTRVLLQTSTPLEGRPNVLLEACEAGVPIVAFDVGGVSSIVSNNVNGNLVKVGNVEEMAKLVGKLIVDEELWNQFSTETRKKAEEEFSWGESLKKYHETLF